ncbi:MAG TPA: glycosyltransferase family 2 protein [Actinomycetota bacterium]|nr:glycosyltransferase family 2 protein [Actinomycetota bacterium]
MDPENSSVLVLLVATNGDPWLREVIEGIRNQTHDDITVIAVDNASTDTSRKLLDKAFGRDNVVRLERRVGYGRALAAALKVVAERAIPADAFLILHDDAVMDAGTIEAMLDAMSHERVGIVGAKLVEYDEPEKLQEVGLTTDRFGRLYNPLETGELDQGQHDGLKEVFFSSTACLLVAREVVERVGLLDLRYVALRDDYDFSWRARIAGYRSVVTSDARVRHAVATYRNLRPGFVSGRIRYFSERNMIASVIKNYGIRSLLVTLPVTIATSLLNAIFFVVTGRRQHARQTLSALQWNIVHLPSTLRARARAQRRRKNPDREIYKFMVRGAPRIRSVFERALEQVVGEPAEGIEEVEGLIAEQRRPRMIDHVRAHPVGIGLTLIAILYLIGARSIYGSGGLAGADMAPFPPNVGDFFSEFFSGWRSAGTGAAAPASPFLFLAGVLSVLTFGSVRLAERLLVLSLVPFACAAAWRAAGTLGLSSGAKRVAASIYALSPITLAAFFQGRLSELVLIAALPAMMIPLFRAAGLAPAGGWRSFAAGSLGLAVVATIAPWALVAVFGAGLVIAIGSVVSGDRRGIRAAVAGAALSFTAIVVLLPWSVELLRPGSPLGARPGPFGVPLNDLIRFVPALPFPIPAPIAWAFPLAAAAGVALASAERRPTARVLATVATLSLLVAWAVSRGVPWIAPRPGFPLVLAAASAAMLAGIAAEGIGPTLRARSFGAAHVALGGIAAFSVAAMVVGTAFLAGGSFDGLRLAGELEPAFFQAEERTFGDFRVLWLAGDTRSLRADLSAPEGETVLTFGARRAGPGEDYLESVLASVVAGRTEQAGRLLAPTGVRYVVMRPAIDAGVVRAFTRQTDMRFYQAGGQGTQVWRNEAWLPIAAAVKSPEWVAAGSSEPERPALAAVPEDPGRAGSLKRVRPGVLAGRIGIGVGAILLGADFSDRWRVHAGGRTIEPAPSFGWATAFATGSASGPVVVAWEGQGWHRLALLLQGAILALIAVAWSRRAARERGER